MIRKYELISVPGSTNDPRGMCRIRALIDIPEANVRIGDLGGWVLGEYNLSHYGTCWISGEAVVRGDARVLEDAQVGGYSLIDGEAEVYGHARVLGGAEVGENARVHGNARIYDDASVYGNARVYGNAVIGEQATVSDKAQVYDDARMHGTSMAVDWAHVHGDADLIAGERVCEEERVN